MNPLLALRDEKTHMTRDYDSHPLRPYLKKTQMLFPPYTLQTTAYVSYCYSNKLPKASNQKLLFTEGMRNSLRKRGTFIVKIS